MELTPTLVIGAGAWGTALAMAIARNKHPVMLWGRNPELIAEMQQAGCNQRYLPDIPFPESLSLVTDLAEAVSQANHILVSIPSVAFSAMLKTIQPHLAAGIPISWATKGLMPESGQFLHDSAREILGDSHPLAIVSGPSFAAEVAKDLPTAMTVASKDAVFSQQLANLMHRTTLRIYTTDDVQGVQIGGALKNILAIASGISDGLGYGANARAALMTRGMAEINRLAMALGADMTTMMGLAGIGDLILTCTDDQSRNRQLGLAIGRGLSVEQAVAELGKTVEGMYATKEVYKKAKLLGIDMPIVEQMHQILFEQYDAKSAVQTLLCREQKAEK